MTVFVQWFRIAPFKSDYVIERHNHSFFELHIIKEGMTGVRLDDGGFTACAGDFYINAPGVYHEQFTDEGSHALEYCLSFSIVSNRIINTEAAALFHILNETPCKPFKDINGMTALFDIALEEAYFKHTGFYNKIRNIASMILINTAQCISEMQVSDYEVHSFTLLLDKLRWSGLRRLNN